MPAVCISAASGRLVLITGVLVAYACSGSVTDGPVDASSTTDAGTNPDAGAVDVGTSTTVIGSEFLGMDCTAACGSADNRKCSSETDDCPICLVDPSHRLIAYCSQDCTNVACPTGYQCEEIKTFGSIELRAVLRGCVAEEAVCGDGILQLGEVCDGDDPQLGRCDNCLGFAALCGDGVIQAPEVCDGNSGEGYCVDDCGRRIAPRFSFESLRNFLSHMNGNDFAGVGIVGPPQTGPLPRPGGANNCDAVEVVENAADVLRLAWTQCDAMLGRATLTFSVPRTATDEDTRANPLPQVLHPNIEIAAADGTIVFNGPPGASARITLSTDVVSPPAQVTGSLSIFESAAGPFFDFDMRFEIWHIPLP